jgi:ribosome assembly protein YihI (activator of Der GTPase)
MVKKTLSKRQKHQKTRKTRTNKKRTRRRGGAGDNGTVESVRSRISRGTLQGPSILQKLPIPQSVTKSVAKPGTWDFYILQALDEVPKTENELTKIIKDQYPDKFKGKTSDNTINYRLQKLVKESKAQRIANKKGKRTVYKYFVWS